jgi:hypothetical protein
MFHRGPQVPFVTGANVPLSSYEDRRQGTRVHAAGLYMARTDAVECDLARRAIVKGIFPVVPPDVLALWKRTGAERFDEMWEGWLRGPKTEVELAAASGKLAIRIAGDDSTRCELPEEED